VNYKEYHFNALVQIWELSLSALIAKSQSQCAYAAFTSGYRHKFNYFLRTLSGIGHLQSVEDVIGHQFIPALCDGRNCNDHKRSLLSIPIRIGGSVEEAELDYTSSLSVNLHLTTNTRDQIENPPLFNKLLT